MTTITKELTVTEKNEALFVERVIDYLDDGDILFAPVPPRKLVKPAVNELDAMAADLAALQAGVVEPIVTTSESVLNAIEDEHIGEKFSTQPFLF